MSDLKLNFTRTHKEKYLIDHSEDDFRDTVVRRLFYRMGYQDGRDLCGPEEHGRDALFVEQHKLGGNRYIGLQTKRGNLNLASKASQNLVDVTAQLRTALQTEYVLIHPYRQAIKPDEVILCCSGKVNNAARNHIERSLDIGSQIRFIDRDDLINLIDRHCPELWLSIETSIHPYLAALKRLAAEDYEHALSRTILRQPIPTACLSDAGFVELRLVAPTVKTRKRHGKVFKSTEFEEVSASSLLDSSSRRLLVLGDPGAGKSTLLLRLAYLAASKAAISERDYVVPIVCRASTLVCEGIEEFIEHLSESTQDVSGANSAAFDSDDLDNGRVLLLIDALDEIGATEKRRRFADTLGQFLENYPKIKLILTARPYLSVSDLGIVSSFSRYRISPISFRQGEKMLRAHLKGEELRSGQVNEILRKVDQVHGFELNPLLVSIFSATARTAQSDLPANVTELFKKFTELMLGRWDEEKGLNQQIHTPIKEYLLKKIAYHMHSMRTTEITVSKFRSLSIDELRKTGHSASAEDLVNEMIDRSGLFRIKGEDIEFRHHMLQEFFAGQGIPYLESVKQLAHDDWWRRPIVFYFGGRPEHVDELFEVVTSAHGIDTRKNFDVAMTAGLALQACYLGEVSEKLDLWKWVASSFGLGIDVFVQGFEENENYPTLSFLLSFLIAKDSLALSVLSQHTQDLLKWANEELQPLDSSGERRLFWLATAMLENGDMDAFQEIIGELKKLPMKEQFALFSGCNLIERVRALDPDVKEKARKAKLQLIDAAQALGPTVVSELGSQLLEYREGKLTAIEEPPQEES